MFVEFVGIKRMREDIALPDYQTGGSAAFDLAASEFVTIEPGELAAIPTGLIFDVPDGYFLGIFARSSTPKKYGLLVANGVGVLDSDYCGPDDEAKILVYNFRTTPVTVERGARIAQGIIMPTVKAMFAEFEHEESAVSRGGFGSTGD